MEHEKQREMSPKTFQQTSSQIVLRKIVVVYHGMSHQDAENIRGRLRKEQKNQRESKYRSKKRLVQKVCGKKVRRRRSTCFSKGTFQIKYFLYLLTQNLLRISFKLSKRSYMYQNISNKPQVCRSLILVEFWNMHLYFVLYTHESTSYL